MFTDKVIVVKEDKDNGSIWLILFLLIFTFFVLFEMIYIIRFGYSIGKKLEITKFPNLDGVLFSLIFIIVFIALIVAGGFCCEVYSAYSIRYVRLEGDMWPFVFFVKGYLSAHLLVALPIFLLIKIIHFVTWIFKPKDSDGHVSNQRLQIVTNED